MRPKVHEACYETAPSPSLALIPYGKIPNRPQRRKVPRSAVVDDAHHCVLEVRPVEADDMAHALAVLRLVRVRVRARVGLGLGPSSAWE